MQEAGDRIERTLIRRAARGFAVRSTFPPFARLLSSVRSSAAGTVFDELGSRARSLAGALEAGEPRARAELAELAGRALSEMRTRTDVAAGRSGMRGVAASLDAWWRNTNQQEYLDDQRLKAETRLEIIAHLDDMNELFGSYRSFFTRLLPYLQSERRTRVLDLAAGSGGFVLAATRLAGAAGLDVEFSASDIHREYLELGATRARAAGLASRFEFQDALDLSNLKAGDYDVITCTQSLHHFDPGQIAVMFSEASRIATRGVVFIDGARSALTAAAVVSLGLVIFRHLPFVHDALISFRRFFVPEELALIARLCPRGERARASWIPPGHCVLELRPS